MEITLRDKMLLEVGIIPKSMKHDAAEAEAGADSRAPAFSYYRCPLCETEYHRPFGERKSRPIRRCPKCWKVVTMVPALCAPELETDADDDVDWVTINGTHTPLKDGEAVGGGKLKGMSFKSAKSEKKTGKAAKQGEQGCEASEPQKRSTTGSSRAAVEGSDVIGSYAGDKDIKAVLKAQGFDGLPTIASKKEFDEAVKESGVVAQRTYTASSQEVLEAYREMLYNGEWYVDCEIGGAQYGQGMYCAADWTGELSEGIQAEMAHYQKLGTSRAIEEAKAAGDDLGSDYTAPSFTETMTLAPDAKVVTYADILAMQQNAGRDYASQKLGSYAKENGEACAAYFRLKDFIAQDGDYEAVMRWQKADPDGVRAAEAFRAEVEREATKVSFDAATMDVGAYAALKGYDAINAEGHGESGSYAVILNRTKTIILDGNERRDGKDEGAIQFQDGGDGLVYAIRNGKIIGWVKASDGTDKAK